MMRLKSTFAIASAAVILAGCNGLELEKAEGLTPSGSEFSKNLYTGYIGLSASEFSEADFTDSDNFAIRATAAANNSAWRQELSLMRQEILRQVQSHMNDGPVTELVFL